MGLCCVNPVHLFTKLWVWGDIEFAGWVILRVETEALR